MTAVTVDGLGAVELAARCGVPRAVLLRDVESTLDVAHALAAEGAPSGTLIVAERQSAGRGRQGREWKSDRGIGVWFTLVERVDDEALAVLALRLGLALAPALDPFSARPVRLKWPNDLWVGERKLAGVLVEARWRDGQPEWAAIGVGINLQPPDGEPGATGLRTGVTRAEVLVAVVPAIRAVVAKTGLLTSDELAEWASRDLAAAREISEPVAGRVLGIDSGGALLVESDGGVTRWRSGSIVFSGPMRE